MSTQRRVTTPPNNQAEAVTDSLRADSPGTPGSTAVCCGAGQPHTKNFAGFRLMDHAPLPRLSRRLT